MVGGYQIIDLNNISVALDGGAVAITDPNIKKQLLSLREYIEENYNFSKPLNNKLKPVMIRLRDAESDEELEGCLWGSVSIIDNNLSFSIDAIVSVNPSKVLQINVVFEQKEDEYDNVFYDIKTATYEYKGGQDSVIVTDIKNIPSVTIKKLQCGDIVLKKDSSGYHAYIVSFRNATGICLTYTDASCVETQSYDKVGNNWVYNSEDKNEFEIKFENIIDKDGHKRFIEGNGLAGSTIEGLTLTYVKWSLSGSHLLLVCCFDIANTKTITNGNVLARFELPSWILEKIIPIWANQYIDRSSNIMVATDWSTQSINTVLSKPTNTRVEIVSTSTVTLTDDRSCRIAYDLLIDNN